MKQNNDLQLQWAEKILAKDKFYSKMQPEEHQRIIREAIRFGAHLAEKTQEQFGVPSGPEAIQEILKILGCIIRINEKSGLGGALSCYEEELSAALFFVRRIRETALAAIEKGEWHSGWYELYAQCTARELFHHLEHALSGKASQHIRFKTKFLGLIPVSHPVETAGKIACLVFVRDFLALQEVPLLMHDE